MINDDKAQSSSEKILKIFGLVPDSIVDGPSLRYAVFVQGCSHGCPGCHNPGSQDIAGGKEYSIEHIFTDIKSNKLVHDVTFSGGEPFEQASACADLACMLKENGYGIWVYTGYIYEDLLDRSEEDESIRKLLEYTDVLVDGPFVESLKSIDLDWRGSSNQRLIDMAKTRSTGCVVEWSRHEISYEKPPSW